MADIELVIKIDEDTYKARQHWVANQKRMIDKVDIAIANGTPLDKHDEEVIAETVESIWGKPPYRDMLDKIRAEIKQLPIYGVKFLNGYFTVHVDVDEVLQIIDKYRGEVDCRECKAEYECYYCKKYEESEDKE